MTSVVAIAGYSNSGKTTLIEKLITELTGRGYKVGTVKHHHKDLEMDQPGKDTWRHARAGARVTLLAAPTRLAKFVQSEEEISLEQALREVTGVDIVLVEGFKGEKLPKIEVFRSEVHDRLITSREDLLAVASDRVFEGIPSYGLDDAAGLCDLLEQRILKPKRF